MDDTCRNDKQLIFYFILEDIAVWTIVPRKFQSVLNKVYNIMDEDEDWKEQYHSTYEVCP